MPYAPSTGLLDVPFGNQTVLPTEHKVDRAIFEQTLQRTPRVGVNGLNREWHQTVTVRGRWLLAAGKEEQAQAG
eukprot:4715210-Pyramimonas_sp.AAC.1